MSEAESAATQGIVERLLSVLKREPALRGEGLAGLVDEKERLILELEQSLRLAEPGAELRVAALQETLASLGYANGLTLKINRLRVQFGRLQNSTANAAPAPRVDLIS